MPEPPRAAVAFLAICLACAPAPPVGAQEASRLLASAHLMGAGTTLVARMEMVIREGRDEKRREVELMIDRSGGRVRTLARIVQPAFLSDMKFLKRSEPGQPEAQWMKTSRGLRRLGESNRSERVFGSHFTVEDFGSVDSTLFEVSFAPGSDTEGERAVVARPLGSAPYASRLILISRRSGLIMGMDYLDASGKALKRYRVLSTTGSGADERPTEASMEDLPAKGSTFLRMISLERPASIPDRYFNPGSL